MDPDITLQEILPDMLILSCRQHSLATNSLYQRSAGHALCIYREAYTLLQDKLLNIHVHFKFRTASPFSAGLHSCKQNANMVEDTPGPVENTNRKHCQLTASHI